MTIEELSFYQSHRDSYKIADNQFKCPICGKIFSVKAFSQHIRKEHYNKENNIKNSGGYNGHYNELNFKQKCSVAASINNEIRNKQKFGELKEFEVKCANPKCNNHFVIIERVKNLVKINIIFVVNNVLKLEYLMISTEKIYLIQLKHN